MNRTSAIRTARWQRPSIFALGLLLATSVPGADRETGQNGIGPLRAMMQRMMADVLPPGLPSKLLPEPASRGARSLARYCTQCHALPGPGRHTAEEWPKVIERMQQRMDMHGRMMGALDIPSQVEIGLIHDYLIAHAQKPLPKSRYGILAEPGGEVFRLTCAQCHALPDPRQHPAAEWPAVVARMQRNMAVMHRPLPDAAAIEQITGFLARHGQRQK